ncbi:DNA adenine methylase [Alteromonas sp. a30]|uniref:DNA adenine methylase n=1 Tax=Alteromonas sp. a30 TaxID=2730917 RepID=UPI002281943B|nr:DNA adenine methylase [Alteromonas sp. a30]MCY7297478.1 DNA adenine methylase [Alteromonas sp. a30]
MSKAIIPWMGGKRRLAKEILPHVNGYQTYVEPFAGGASIFFMKEPAKAEVINDINGELVNLYRVVKHHLDEFVRHFRWALVSREEFITAKKTDPNTLTDIQRAARFYYLQKLAFGGKVTGQTFGTAKTTGPKLNLLRIEEDLSNAHLRLARTTIEHLPWDKCIERYDTENTVFYLDPPYWETTGYGNKFTFDNYEHMADLAKRCKGKFVISINDHPDIREVFKGFELRELEIKHKVGGSVKTVDRRELVILG